VRSHPGVWLSGLAGLALACAVTACQPPASGASASGASASGTVASPSATPARPTAAASPGYAVPAGPVVALGDSYTAGALLPLDEAAVPPGCLRSQDAYPVLVATALKAPLTDVACTNAGVKEMTAAQKTYLGMNPPQLAALRPDDALVLLTLGGDDMGFMNVLQTCMKLSVTDPWGSPCEAHYTNGGTDQLAARVRAEAPRLAAVLRDIAADAPHARIAVVGYPDLFPLSGGCWPAVPISDGDIAYLRGIETQLNAMLAADAQAAGATYVNTFTATIGHDFCEPESTRDVEGLIPGSAVLPFHPNARGQAAIAAAVLNAVRA
jgi:lysophospholipase L1-like esterase